ncbi:MAG: hypothetical protein ACJARX_000205, partial [Psychroserpens sp.]
MNYILFDGPSRNNLLPFTFTRPVADLRVGILTIREKWENHLGSTITTITEDYLSEKYPMVELDENIMINASFLPNDHLVDIVKGLKENQVVFSGEDMIAFFTKDSHDEVNLETYEAIEYNEPVLKIEHSWDLFSNNGEAIKADFDLLTQGRESQPIPNSCNVLGAEHIFIEEGAKLEFATLNANSGPIYIGKDAEVMEGA